MTTLIIHAGMHKTGTSSVQATLARLPRGRGASYLMLDANPNASPALNWAFADERRLADRGLWGPDGPQRRAEMLRRFAERCATLQGEKTVLSAEVLQRFTVQELQALLSHVRHAHVKFLVYFREPYGRSLSGLQQGIKEGWFQNWDLSGALPTYRAANEKFLQHDVDFIPYDRQLLHKGCVVRDLCHRVGMEVAPEEVVTANESLNRSAASLLYCRNVWRAARGLARVNAAQLVRRGLFRTLPGAKLSVHPALWRDVLTTCQADIEWAAGFMPAGWADVPRVPETETCIRSEADLLRVPPEGLDWLSERMGRRVPPDLESVGAAVDVLLQYAQKQLRQPPAQSQTKAASPAVGRFNLPV